MNKKNTVILVADKDKLEEAIKPIIEVLESLEVESKIIYKINLTLEELLVNVALYAYPKGEEGYLSVGYEIMDNPKQIVITIKDKGKPFDPLTEVKEPDLDASIEDRKIGGLGVFLAKKTMDELIYHRIGDENVLIIKKTLE